MCLMAKMALCALIFFISTRTRFVCLNVKCPQMHSFRSIFPKRKTPPNAAMQVSINAVAMDMMHEKKYLTPPSAAAVLREIKGSLL